MCWRVGWKLVGASVLPVRFHYHDVMLNVNTAMNNTIYSTCFSCKRCMTVIIDYICIATFKGPKAALHALRTDKLTNKSGKSFTKKPSEKLSLENDWKRALAKHTWKMIGRTICPSNSQP